jgi:hypothetical protein
VAQRHGTRRTVSGCLTRPRVFGPTPGLILRGRLTNVGALAVSQREHRQQSVVFKQPLALMTLSRLAPGEILTAAQHCYDHSQVHGTMVFEQFLAYKAASGIGNTCILCRHEAAAVMVNDTLVIHGGEVATGIASSDMAGLDLSRLLTVWPASSKVTCTLLGTAVQSLGGFAWDSAWRICDTATGPVRGHAMALLPGQSAAASAVLLHGGLSAGTVEQVRCQQLVHR